MEVNLGSYARKPWQNLHFSTSKGTFRTLRIVLLHYWARVESIELNNHETWTTFDSHSISRCAKQDRYQTWLNLWPGTNNVILLMSWTVTGILWDILAYWLLYSVDSSCGLFPLFYIAVVSQVIPLLQIYVSVWWW